MSNNTYFASKPRYEILDGLRGVAAMLVVAFHLFETYSPGPTQQIINHGYLAVDFFFVLSGFVIGYAYDDRWHGTRRMSTWNFAKRRLVRLHPMLVCGTLIGAALFFFTDGGDFARVGSTPLWMFALCLAMGCLMLPTPPSLDIRGWGEVNSFNGSSWSLMWEYVANILYALVIRRFPNWLLAVMVACSAVMTADLALNLDLTGLLQARSWAAYTVIGGWSLTPDQLYIGIARLFYPFFAGLLLSRMGRLVAVRGGFWWCSAIVVAVLAWPHIGGSEPNAFDGAYQLAAILLVFPLVVLMGAGSSTTDQRSAALCKWLGEISYPLYITHYPWIYLHMTWAASHQNAPAHVHIMVAVSLFVVTIAMAWATLRLWDEPVRAWLKKKWFD